MLFQKENEFNTFCKLITKLRPEEVMGVAKILKVDLIEPLKDGQTMKDAKMRDSQHIMLDMCNAYNAMNRKERRQLLKTMKKAAV